MSRKSGIMNELTLEEISLLMKQREIENDGQTVNIYYDTMTGMYLSFGQSAYYVTWVVNPILSYSDELEMPVAILSKRKFFDVRQSMALVEKISHEYYKLKMRKKIGDNGYEKWIRELQDNK